MSKSDTEAILITAVLMIGDVSRQSFGAEDAMLLAAENRPLIHDDGKRHLLLAASGSIALTTITQVILALAPHQNLSIRLILTPSAEQCFTGQPLLQLTLAEFSRQPNVDGIYTNAAEWANSWTRGASILHIEMRRWADIFIVCPLSANTMAKMVMGSCDSLLLSVFRAWDIDGSVDGARKKIMLVPGMSTAMWHNHVTARHIRSLEETGGGNTGSIEVLSPTVTPLHGDLNLERVAIAGWQEIVTAIYKRLGFDTSAAVSGIDTIVIECFYGWCVSMHRAVIIFRSELISGTDFIRRPQRTKLNISNKAVI